MEIYVDDAQHRVLINWGRGPLTTITEAGVVGEQHTEAGGQVYDSNEQSRGAREDAIWDEAHDKGVEQERADMKRRKGAPDWLKIVTEYVEVRGLGSELLDNLTEAGKRAVA